MMQALERIRELQGLRGILPEWELARRAREILDRADMKPLDLAIYLEAKGITGDHLFRSMGTFGKAVKAAYVAEHGVEPMHTLAEVNGRIVRVLAYIELDRPLIDAVFEEWSK